MKKVGRNDRCPCGSGKKYKKCCLKKKDLGYQLHLKGKRAEEFLFNLATKSFFTDWCYPNPILTKGKEICDLLIIYDDIAIIWQVKDLKLNDKGRYKESEVRKNLRQISGAKRSLFGLKKTIKLENPRRGEEEFNPNLIKEIYLISALLGKGEDFFSPVEDVKGHIIHTFTREFTEIALSELDTIQDFIDYLREKEKTINGCKKLIISGGEQELLAFYLRNNRNLTSLTEPDCAIVEEGWWEELQKDPRFLGKKREDKISYCWDSIIERAHTCGGEYELVARELARPNRFERRRLSNAFFEAHKSAHNGSDGHVMRIVKSDGMTICFLFMNDVEPRVARKALLGTICFLARGIHRDNQKVIGIATEKEILPECTYDFCLFYLPKWTDENQEEMENIQKETGLFQTPTLRHEYDDEYPSK